MMAIYASGRHSVRAGGILFLAVALLFCSGQGAAVAEDVSQAVSVVDAFPCENLKPFNNLNELLNQFYTNLDSDCLFEMSTAELERVWNIKILDEERAKPKNFYPLSETEFYQKPYKTEKDAFYIERSWVKVEETLRNKQHFINKFTLKPTKKYMEKYGGFFTDGKMPQLTPERAMPTNLPGYIYGSSDKTRSIAANVAQSGVIEILQRSGSPVIKKRDGKFPIEALGETAEKTSDAPCRGLKPFNNLDELLYQFYINLDSDCLFYMSVAELEKIWDTKILSDERSVPGEFKASDFAQKPYKSEKDAFYLEVKGGKEGRPNSFYIHITEDYYKDHATLFPDGHLPRLCPEALKIYNTSTPEGWTLGSPSPPIPNSGGINFSMRFYHYYWLNSRGTNMILLDGFYGVDHIFITTHVPPAFKKRPGG